MSEQKKLARPGEAALESMKLLQKESSLFKIPKVPKKKSSLKSNRVLDEDVYVQGIGKIIQRDFFPDLEKLNAQNEFLEATENKDYNRLKEIAMKYSSNQSRPPTEPYNTPATFETPHIDGVQLPLPPTVREQDQECEQVATDNKPKDITENHTLDSFLSTHTSEDNASYCRVIALEEKKRTAKLDSQYQAEVNSLALAEAASRLPLIEEQADHTMRPIELDTWVYRAKNHIMYVPDGAASQPASARPQLVHRNTRLRSEPFDHARSKEAISAIARTQDATITGKIGVDGVSISTGEKMLNIRLWAPLRRGPVWARPIPSYDLGPTSRARPSDWTAGIRRCPLWARAQRTACWTVGAGGDWALQLAERASAPPPPHHTARHAAHIRFSEQTRSVWRDRFQHPRRSSTPLVAKPNTPLRTGQSDNITDNLLQINVTKRTRLKAQDFFT
ncbi:hypothetical protein ACJJTC_006040 [Scirpophaga incertulas]